MSASWKRVLIGSEVTVLAVLTGVGVHLAIRPHNTPVPPPTLTVPALASLLPSAPPSPRRTTSVPSRGKEHPPSPGWSSQLGREDRRQVTMQWEIVRQLIKGIEHYLVERVIPEMQRGG